MNVPLSPVRCLYRAIDLYPRKTGVVCGPQRFSYQEFGERCERLAGGLRTVGVESGDRVAFLGFNTHELLEGYYGPILIGAICMPLNVRLTPHELIGILQHAEPKVLIFEPEFEPLVQSFRAACPGLQTLVNIGSSSTADVSYEDLLSKERISRPDPFQFDENTTAELFYTSGSTGTPKGVMLSHRNLYLHALEVALSLRVTDDLVHLHTIPLFHANGWGRPQTLTMMGSTHVMLRRFDPVQVFELIERERVTGMSLVPVMANAILNCPERERFDLSSLREIELGGAPGSPELVAKLEQSFRCNILAGYGLTETSPVACFSRHKSTVVYRDEEDRLRRTAMAGWPIVGCEARVVEPTGEDTPRDGIAIGEVVMRGDNVMQGYYREPQSTAATIRDGWLHSGDMAVWDEENYIHIVDRQKDIIISGGENISSVEIERAIASHDAVLECAVVAAPDDKWGEVPAAVVVCKPGVKLSAGALTLHLEGRLARFKMPRQIIFSDEPLPKTGTNKILKRQLREPFWAGKEKRVQG
jgi:fatty-acyl-CoA synthase